MQAARAPSPRYERPTKRPNIQLTDDDIEVIWTAYRRRVVDAKSFQALLPHRSLDVLSRRLHKLWQHTYLDRIRQASQFKVGGGSDSLCYALGHGGAAYLRAKHGDLIAGDRWTQRNRQLRPYNVAHMLKTTHAMVLFEQSTRQHPEQELRHFDQLLSEFAPDRLKQASQSKTLRPRVEWRDYREREGTKPDEFFAVCNRQAAAGKQHRVLFLEIDEGTETIEPTEKVLRHPHSFFKGSSILRKLVVYGHAYEQRTHQKLFGVPAFQVLTITTAPERAELMRQAYLTHLAGPPYSIRPALFLFTDWQTIEQFGGDMFEVPVLNGAGTVRSLAVPSAQETEA